MAYIVSGFSCPYVKKGPELRFSLQLPEKAEQSYLDGQIEEDVVCRTYVGWLNWKTALTHRPGRR